MFKKREEACSFPIGRKTYTVGLKGGNACVVSEVGEILEQFSSGGNHSAVAKHKEMLLSAGKQIIYADSRMIQLCACVWQWPSFHFSREGNDSWAFPSHVRNVMKEIANILPLDLTSLSVISAFLFFIGKFIDDYKCGIFIIFLFLSLFAFCLAW